MKTFVVCIIAFIGAASSPTYAACEVSRALLVLNDAQGGLSSTGPLLTAETQMGTVDVRVSPSGDPNETAEEATVIVTATVRLTGREEPIIAVHRVASGELNAQSRTSVGDLSLRGQLNNGASLDVAIESCGGAQ